MNSRTRVRRQRRQSTSNSSSSASTAYLCVGIDTRVVSDCCHRMTSDDDSITSSSSSSTVVTHILSALWDSSETSRRATYRRDEKERAQKQSYRSSGSVRLFLGPFFFVRITPIAFQNASTTTVLYYSTRSRLVLMVKCYCWVQPLMSVVYCDVNYLSSATSLRTGGKRILTTDGQRCSASQWCQDDVNCMMTSW